MKPQFDKWEAEKHYDIKIEDVEKVLDKSYYEQGSAQKATAKLKELLDSLKNK
ncbi:MAG: hypothetical protein IKC35_02090 [Clostridia bacterium]|nr:hypothetical protein [Clostridia bacterium]